MPQLDATWFASQLFWLGVSFILLYTVLARSLAPRIQDVLEARQSRIDQDVEAATRFKEEAENAKRHFETAMASSRAESQKMIAGAQEAAKQALARTQTELEATLAKEINAADREIETAKQNALADLAPIAGELAGYIIEKLAGLKLSSQELTTAVDMLRRERRL